MSDPYGQPPPEQPEGENPGQQTPGQQAPGQQTPGQPYGQPPAPSGYGQQPPGLQQPGQAALTPDERTWGGAAHWGALVAGLFGGLSFLGPLIVLLVKGNDSPWIRRQSVESLNFQISILIYAIVSGILIILLIGILLLPAVLIGWLVFTVIGSVKASNGEDYRYPLTIRMVS